MIAIISGCGANIASVQFALMRLGKTSVLTNDSAIIQSASHVILPGVGTAKKAMHHLEQSKLVDVILSLQQPVLGICLGMQLFYTYSHEGNVPCLGIFPGDIEDLPEVTNMPLPHMGWNQLEINDVTSPLLNQIPNGSYCYFVHSYAAPVNQQTIASTDYGKPFSAIVQHKNFYGAQFHPERSGKIGERILENFLCLI